MACRESGDTERETAVYDSRSGHIPVKEKLAARPGVLSSPSSKQGSQQSQKYTPATVLVALTAAASPARPGSIPGAVLDGSL